jgi:hypothetical protein
MHSPTGTSVTNRQIGNQPDDDDRGVRADGVTCECLGMADVHDGKRLARRKTVVGSVSKEMATGCQSSIDPDESVPRNSDRELT